MKTPRQQGSQCNLLKQKAINNANVPAVDVGLRVFLGDVRQKKRGYAVLREKMELELEKRRWSARASSFL